MINVWRKIFGKKKDQRLTEIDREYVPHHVAVIMDGNGRWAKERGLPRIAGHHSGMKNVKTIAMAADAIGVKVLTLYAFSTENWKRPRDEVDFLLTLPQEFFPLEIDELHRNNVQIRMMGYKEDLPAHTLDPVNKAIERTRNNTGMILNFALNYGGRRELVGSMRQMAEDVQAGHLQVEQIDEQTYSRYLLSSGIPDPDLLIRTSGELRISNFMLWQLAYTELWFTDVYWPGFEEEHFYQAIRDYQYRTRRFGGL